MDNPTAVLVRPGEIRIEDRPVPEPGPHEVLIRVEAVGVCGSDTHYYQHGGIGRFIVRAPLVLGHEPGGEIVGLGPEASRHAVGTRVAIEPGVPCGRCRQCRLGNYNLCAEMRFMATPPIDGAFARYVTMHEDFAHPIPDTLSFEDAALLEPLSVGIWACRRAAFEPGDRVLVTGAGPVGLLAALVARSLGAASVTVSDVNEARLAVASGHGFAVRNAAEAAGPDADTGPNAAGSGDGPDADTRPNAAGTDAAGSGAGAFDVLLECSGAPKALPDGLRQLDYRGRAAMVGLPATAEVSLPLVALHDRELSIALVFRYAHTWPLAISLAASGAIPTGDLVTHRFPLAEVEQALTLGERDRTALKAMVLPQR
jgi:L-iditol 2-dehydrogenase